MKKKFEVKTKKRKSEKSKAASARRICYHLALTFEEINKKLQHT